MNFTILFITFGVICLGMEMRAISLRKRVDELEKQVGDLKESVDFLVLNQ